ncbi:hypothetical protein ACLOJK_022939 [Asimina triloba]
MAPRKVSRSASNLKTRGTQPLTVVVAAMNRHMYSSYQPSTPMSVSSSPPGSPQQCGPVRPNSFALKRYPMQSYPSEGLEGGIVLLTSNRQIGKWLMLLIML